MESRPIEALIADDSPLAGKEQHVLREWIAEWTFDIHQFSDLAQTLVRGDIASLQRDYQKLVDHYTEQSHSHEESLRKAADEYRHMRETRLKMPAMEVVIAGAQYYVGRKDSNIPSDDSSMSTAHAASAALATARRHGHSHSPPEHARCLRFLREAGVNVDDEDVAGFTAFMRASQTSHSRLDLAEVLLELGADVNHKSRFGGVVLHEAMMAQDRRAVAFLTRNGASMDIRDNDGVSPRDIVSLIL
ncbi:ankyrin [Martensiomyces pterosporus]|nr:ankyrin [Martensiomyces pterosporus]